MVDYFQIFNIPRKFFVDLSDLEKKFYEQSRLYHPDRFSTLGAEAKQASLEKMSELNQAFTTLKNPEFRCSYLLKLEGVVSDTKKSQIPLELTEAWFELQELILEDPRKAQEKSMSFEKEIQKHFSKIKTEINSLEKEYDTGTLQKIALEKIALLLDTQSYLKSLERDFTRKMKHEVS